MTPEDTPLAIPAVREAIDCAYHLGYEDGRAEAEAEAGQIIEALQQMGEAEVLGNIVGRVPEARSFVDSLRRVLRRAREGRDPLGRDVFK